LVGLFFLFVVLFHFIGMRGQIKAYTQSEKELSSKKEELTRVQDSVEEKKKECVRWEQAVQDIEYLNDHYFYKGKKSIHHIRQDLNKLFDETGVQAESIQYEYSEFRDRNIQKITISFSITGTYFLIKKFLFEVEKMKKFLYVEKITFKDIERERGRVQLGLSLAANYEK